MTALFIVVEIRCWCLKTCLKSKGTRLSFLQRSGMQPISFSGPSAIAGPRKAKSQSWKVDSLESLKKCSQGHRFENGWDAAPSSLQSIFPQIKRRSIISSPQPLGREDKNDESVLFCVFTAITWRTELRTILRIIQNSVSRQNSWDNLA